MEPKQTFFFGSILLTIREKSTFGEIVSIFGMLTTKCSRCSRNAEWGRAQDHGGRRPPKCKRFGGRRPPVWRPKAAARPGGGVTVFARAVGDGRLKRTHNLQSCTSITNLTQLNLCSLTALLHLLELLDHLHPVRRNCHLED